MRWRLARVVPSCLMVGLSVWLAGVFAAEAEPAPPATPLAGDEQGLHNLHRLSDTLYSGSQPDGEEAFAELARLGITTVISVDGARPALEAAARHGLRYIHIPTGYAGIDADAQARLVKAARTADGPIYIHCHHGKHRGPAGAAICMMGTGDWSKEQANAWLKQAGTSSNYTGLYRDIANYAPPSEERLAAIEDLPPYVPVPDLVAAMATLDRHWDNLQLAAKHDFGPIPDHPDITAEQEALIIAEALREIGRLPETESRPEEFRTLLKESEKAAWGVHEAVRKGEGMGVGVLKESCEGCHGRYRD